MEWECNCSRCNGDGPLYPPEHEEECCCEGCHEEYHEIASEWEAICGTCEDICTEEKEEADGNDQQQKS